VYDEQESYLARGGGAAFTPSNPLLPVSAGRVLIDAVAARDVQALRANLEALGMQGVVAFAASSQGNCLLPPSRAWPRWPASNLHGLRMRQPMWDWSQARVIKPCAPTSRAPPLARNRRHCWSAVRQFRLLGRRNH
jgi:hypothetical protein